LTADPYFRSDDFGTSPFPTLFGVALAAGLMFTPDRLTLLGNVTGSTGLPVLIALAGGIAVYLVSARRMEVLPAGGVSAWHPAVWARVPFAVCAATGLLVSAGYAFNEVFAYWFPNFAFAYLMLGTVVAVNVIGKRAVAAVQIVSVGAAAAGLAVLSIAGIAAPPEPPPNAAGASEGLSLKAASIGLLLPVGFDLAASARETNRRGSVRSSMIWGLAGGGTLLLLWGAAGWFHVPADRLAGSTVPHMSAARAVLGQAGRYMMGAVVIFSVLAAVNALFFALSRCPVPESDSGGKAATRARLAMLTVLAGAPALMMALGLAGEPVLEVWIRAGVVLWLFYYLLTHAGGLIGNRSGVDAGPPYAAGLAVSAIGLALAALVAAEEERFAMAAFLVAAPVVAGAAAAAVRRLARSA
jgi:hypothetical protein